MGIGSVFSLSNIVSGLVGALAPAVIGPLIKYQIEERSRSRDRKRAQIESWRKMILDVATENDSEKSDSYRIQVHPDFLSLHALLTPSARAAVPARRRTYMGGVALQQPFDVLVEEVNRIEKEWKLNK